MPEWLFIDFDGTLADSHPLLYETYCTLMRQHGQEPSVEEFEELIGPSLPEVVESLRWKYGLEVSAEALLDQYMMLLRQRYPQEAQLFPGAGEVLRNFAQQKVKMAIVTSAPAVVVQKFLLSKDLDSVFQHIVDPAGLQASKPEPDIYQRALEVTQAAPEAVLAIEDSEAGVVAAQRAGIPVIQIVQGLNLSIVEGVPTAKGWKELWEKVAGK